MRQTRPQVLLIALLTLACQNPAIAIDGQSDRDNRSACRKINEARVKVPSDFAIFIASTASHTSRNNQIEIRASGRVEKTSTRRNKTGGRETVTSEHQVSEAVVRKIYAMVLACNYFSLYKSYRKRGVRSGYVRALGVTAAGRSQTTSVMYLSVKRFDTIFSAVASATDGEVD